VLRHHFAAAFIFYLEGESEAEIDMDKIFHSGIEVVIPAADPIIVASPKIPVNRYSAPPPIC